MVKVWRVGDVGDGESTVKYQYYQDATGDVWTLDPSEKTVNNETTNGKANVGLEVKHKLNTKLYTVTPHAGMG